MNRLASESSPYLLLHAHNPVDWFPWGPEALDKARREDKPIFLSVGYSTCYWCHVMERESFSSPEIAERMNRDWVNVKLDREERPDLDEIYMAATQILTGQGGWPNSVFLTPELLPFYAGTYFPPVDRYGRPGFATVLTDLAKAWRDRRADVDAQAEEMSGALRRFLEDRAAPASAPPSPEAARRAMESLARRFDTLWGGFGGAPKFPTPSNLFLLAELAEEHAEAGRMLSATLDAMARGGIYDQLAGGFHRYATDREWKVPHFEKMLYDNGPLLELYAVEHARTGDPQAARIVRQTAEWLAREMTSPEGAFHSAIDAETHGHEGAYSVWSKEELAAILGEEDALFLAPLLGFDGPPFFEGDRYVLHLPMPLEQAAARRRLDQAELLRDLDAGRARLLAARDRRPRPLTDDKVLADWNGMAIAGLAVAGRLLGEPGFVAQAVRAADFVTTRMREGGRLVHAWRAGEGKIPAYLGDYAFLVRGLLALHDATREPRWLDLAQELTREQSERLADPQGGFFVGGVSPDVLFRSKDVFDGATPSANAIAALNLLALADKTGDGAWRAAARAALCAFAPVVDSHPDAVRMLAVAVRRFHQGGSEPWAAAAPAAPDALSRQALELVRAELEVAEGAGEGERRRFRLALDIAPGWHLQANPAADEHALATTLAGNVDNVVYPPGPLYEGRVEVTGEILGEGPVQLTYQACDDRRCLPAVTRAILSPL